MRHPCLCLHTDEFLWGWMSLKSVGRVKNSCSGQTYETTKRKKDNLVPCAHLQNHLSAHLFKVTSLATHP